MCPRGNWRQIYTPDEMRILRNMYEGVLHTNEEIADRFGISPSAVRTFAHRRGWKRHKKFYRAGVQPKEIPPARVDTAQLLWDSGESTARIARWIGCSETTALALCSKLFGFRNLRLNKQTYFIKRNLEIMAMYDTGHLINEIADMHWIGSRTVREIIRNMDKKGVSSLYTSVLSNGKPTSEYDLKLIEKHERVVHAAIACTAVQESVGAQFIIWPTKGTQPLSSARGICMYLTHVEASYNLSQTGILYGRDRTTVAHACALVEDKREDELFDKSMDALADKFKEKAGLLIAA